MRDIFWDLIIIYMLSAVQSSSPDNNTRGWTLNDGNIMPPIAFGTFGKITDFENLSIAVEWAIEAGYRHFDTAFLYFNEEVFGISINNVIRRGIVTREELFITTKLDYFVNRDVVISTLRESLEMLQMDYIDLYLIHFPHDPVTIQDVDYIEVWKGMEDAKRLGLTRSIGLSNFNSSHINNILVNSQIPPAVNEKEINPTFTNLELESYCQRQGIRVMSYAPFGFLVPRPWADVPNSPPTLDHPILTKIAAKYNKKTNEVVIRYLLDRGTTPMPKSNNREHIISNINVFDFYLTKQEVYLISQLNLNTKVYHEFTENFCQYFYNTSRKNFLETFSP